MQWQAWWKKPTALLKKNKKVVTSRDAGLILSAQKVEHYEIATYGGLAQLAKTMGNEENKNLLGETLDEEKEADEMLTTLAEGSINESATKEGMEEEEPAEEYASINLKAKNGKK